MKPGRIILEAGASPRDFARLCEALAVARRKLPVFVQLVTRPL